MGFRKQPNLMASGAAGVFAGLILAGGLLFALSLPAQAEISQNRFADPPQLSAPSLPQGR